MAELQAQGYSRYNDINRDWNSVLAKARAEAHNGRKVAISDIMFCDQTWRHRLEQELGLSLSWIFMENDAWQCAKNCLFRFMYQKPYRPLQDEIRMIGELSRIYSPYGDIRPVPKADAEALAKWPWQGAYSRWLRRFRQRHEIDRTQ